MVPKTVGFDGLKIGDVIRISKNPFADCVVKNLKRDSREITLFRPYGHTCENIITSQGTICYVGTEEFTTFSSPGETFEVVQESLI